MNVVFPCCANWETFVDFVSGTNVARAGKRGNICVGNNVSATMCPRLPTVTLPSNGESVTVSNNFTKRSQNGSKIGTRDKFATYLR